MEEKNIEIDYLIICHMVTKSIITDHLFVLSLFYFSTNHFKL